MSEFNELIATLAPIHRAYMQREGTPLDHVILMWRAGEVLKGHLKRFEGTPNRLFREIYGKSEGKKNIKQRSYISREFQSRSFRVRGMFADVDQLRSELESLVSLNAFREAMPFFDNSKYKLTGKDRDELLRVLNDSSSTDKALKYIESLRKKLIGKVNSRKQRLNDLKIENMVAQSFIKIITSFLVNDFEPRSEILPVSKDELRMLSRLTGALTAEGLKWEAFDASLIAEGNFRDYASMLHSLLSDQTAVRRRRFRRLLSIEKLADLAEALFALSDPTAFQKNKNRLIETLNN